MLHAWLWPWRDVKAHPALLYAYFPPRKDKGLCRLLGRDNYRYGDYFEWVELWERAEYYRWRMGSIRVVNF